MPLFGSHFDIQIEKIKRRLAVDPTIKIIFICSPGNPTGMVVPQEIVESILDVWDGIIVVDEAYIDIATPASTMLGRISSRSNLIVLQTLSKAMGLAGIRVGFVAAHPDVARLLNTARRPYNINSISALIAEAALDEENVYALEEILPLVREEKRRLSDALEDIKGVGKLRGGQMGNFLLFEILRSPSGEPCNETASRLVDILLKSSNVLVTCKVSGNQTGCKGCLRVTVGRRHENDTFLIALQARLDQCRQ